MTPLFLLIALVSANSDYESLVHKLTACWIVSVHEVSLQQASLNTIIEAQIQLGNTNRTAIFYKVQTDMVQSCIEEITETESDKIIQAIQDDVKDHKTFRQIVQDFNYEDYNQSTFTWEFTPEDLSLLRFFKDFEHWVSTFQKKEAKPNPQNNKANVDSNKESVLQELKNKILQLAKDKKTSEQLPGKDQQRMAKNLFYKEQQENMKNPYNYILAIIFAVILGSLLVFAYRMVTKQEVVGQKKNKKSKQQ